MIMDLVHGCGRSSKESLLKARAQEKPTPTMEQTIEGVNINNKNANTFSFKVQNMRADCVGGPFAAEPSGDS